MENVRNCSKIEFIKKDDIKNIIKQQIKLTFNGIHESYENCDSYTLKQNEVLMDKPIYLRLALLELSKLLMYEKYYINYNLILDRKIYNHNIWILIVLC